MKLSDIIFIFYEKSLVYNQGSTDRKIGPREPSDTFPGRTGRGPKKNLRSLFIT